MGGPPARTGAMERAVRTWMRTWNELDRDGFLALLAPSFVAKGAMGPEGVGGEATWDVMVAFRRTFPDIAWQVGRWLVAEGDELACEVIESGTFSGPWGNPRRRIRPTNRRYRSSAAMWFRFDRRGRIVENEAWYDALAWFRQIGVDPNEGAPERATPDAVAIVRDKKGAAAGGRAHAAAARGRRRGPKKRRAASSP